MRERRPVLAARAALRSRNVAPVPLESRVASGDSAPPPIHPEVGSRRIAPDRRGDGFRDFDAPRDRAPARHRDALLAVRNGRWGRAPTRCRRCGSDTLEPIDLPGRGRLVLLDGGAPPVRGIRSPRCFRGRSGRSGRRARALPGTSKDGSAPRRSAPRSASSARSTAFPSSHRRPPERRRAGRCTPHRLLMRRAGGLVDVQSGARGGNSMMTSRFLPRAPRRFATPTYRRRARVARS